MSTKTIIVRYINSGTTKDGRNWWNIKDENGDQYWSKTGEPHPNVAQGGQYEVDYSVGRNGSNNIVSLRSPSSPTSLAKPLMRAEMAPKDALGAFRTTAFCAFVKAGLIPLEAASIRDALRKIEAGYNQSVAAPMIQSGVDFRDELDDEIPDFNGRQ